MQTIRMPKQGWRLCVNEDRYCITPTGDRRKAFALCVSYMNAQIEPPDKWIIVDDGMSDAVESQLGNIRIPFEIIRLNPLLENTLIRNLSAAFCRVAPGAKTVIIEDDDCYLPGYLANMWRLLDEFDAVGSRFHRYYNVAKRCFWEFRNSRTMALHSCGFARDAWHIFRKQLIGFTQTNIDREFGRYYPYKRGYNDQILPVHIVGMTDGRAGTTWIHRKSDQRWKTDADGKKLSEWCGDYYKNYLGEYNAES